MTPLHFDRDAELVCRHAQCDLATTTNILETPLAATCTGGVCCASNVTLAQFKSLCGRMENFQRDPFFSFRTLLYDRNCPELMSHK
eukprot:6185831-Pleurochrysis_carterae.AAC.1